MAVKWVAATAIALAALAVAAAQRESAEVLWDTYGVPHIFADSSESAAYAYGYAQGRDHSSLLLRFVGVARGRAAEYWGASWRLSDARMWARRIPQFAERLYALQNDEGRRNLEATAAGFNKYMDEHPDDVLETGLLVVLPLTGLDLFKHGLRAYHEFSYAAGYTKSFGNEKKSGRDDGFKDKHESERVHYSGYIDYDAERRQWEPYREAFGSNAWAIKAPKADALGAKINMNPHLPYTSFFRWTEAHIVVPNEDYDFYGTGFVGLPNLQIGFNRFVSWTHTVNVISPYTVYNLQLANERQYPYDGQLLTLGEERFPFKVLQENGSYVEEVVVIETSVHGDVFRRRDGEALVIRLAGADRPDPVYQWTQMSRARSFDEFKDAMRNLQISMFMTVVATHDSNIMSSFNGFVPKRSEGDWAFWTGLVPGDSSRYVWDELHPWDELPRAENPASGWVHNCNSPPWDATFPLYDKGVNPADFPPYMSAPPYMGFRPQVSARMMHTNSNLTFERFIELKHSTTKEYANHVVDDLVAAIETYGNGELDLMQAARTLRNWDRTMDADAAGSVLFDTWTRKVVSPVFVNGWSDQDPLGTPNTLRDPQGAVEAVREAIREMRLRGRAIDEPWGNIHRFPDGPRPSLTFPGHGDAETFRNVWWAGDDLVGLVGGDSFIGMVEYNPRGIRASTLIGYGNASPQSRGATVFAHNNDMWERFAAKQLKPVRLTRADIEANLEDRALLVYSRS